MLTRIQKLLEIREDSMFLWGPRQTGKSTLLKQLFPDAPYYDLLKSEVYHQSLSYRTIRHSTDNVNQWSQRSTHIFRLYQTIIL